jgi:hypothetical protein
MGKDGIIFGEVEKSWRTTCNHFAKDVQIW